MRRLLPWFVAAMVACGFEAEAHPDLAASEQAVVYDSDNRVEVMAHPNAVFRRAAGSVVMMTPRANVDISDPARPGYHPNLPTLAAASATQGSPLCNGVAFANQPKAGVCSGTLIDARHVLTAGHCVNAPGRCEDYFWVFGYSLDTPTSVRPLATDDVYACRRVSAVEADQATDGRDYAIVELDRDVVGHDPAPFVLSPVRPGTQVAIIGHPEGIPMKIADSAVVLGSHANTLRATVDAFRGNSGAGIFDAAGNLVAVMNSGEADYVNAGGCFTVNRVAVAGAAGEKATHVSVALEAMCRVGVFSPICTRCTGVECLGPPGEHCTSAEPLETRSQTVRASLDGFTHDSRSLCGGRGADRMYTLTLPTTGVLDVRVTGIDATVSLRRSCADPELTCAPDGHLRGPLEAGAYVLIVDANSEGVGGSFELMIDVIDPAAPPPPTAQPTADGGVGTADMERERAADAGAYVPRTRRTSRSWDDDSAEYGSPSLATSGACSAVRGPKRGAPCVFVLALGALASMAHRRRRSPGGHDGARARRW